MTKDKNHKPNPSRYPINIPLQNKDKFPDLPSFASVTNGTAKPTVYTSSINANTRTLILDDQDLINVEDPSMVLLAKLKYVNSLSNMYVIYNFQTNASLKSVYSCINTVTPSFKVNERMIWIEIRGLSLCAWGSNAYKKVADMFGKFMFFEAEESTEMSSGTWNINIVDDTLDSSDNIDVNSMEKVKDSVEENYLADLNDLNNLKETINELASNKIQHPINKENIDQEDDINKDADNFNSFIENSGLTDLSLGGGLFTWMNKFGTKLSKLDQFLISEESIEDKIKAGSANDDDRDLRIKLLQEVDILDTFESFDLFQKARVK
ncbi:hypothetical protein Tco_0909636 [Tanacetum coccineum]|uniref:DUF4283 domain-containing protein n=1 Tax=Tanacetum coccineum TaxID=301880 RepID=A0ABQ5CQJ1_9ASTR